MPSSATKTQLRLATTPLRGLCLKYISEVSCLRRDLNWQLSHLLERDDISRRQLLAAWIRLDAQDADLVSAIRSDGHAKVRVDAFCPKSMQPRYLRSIAESFGTPGLEEIAKSRSGSSKYYWTNLCEPPASGSDPLLDFTCNPRTLESFASRAVKN